MSVVSKVQGFLAEKGVVPALLFGLGATLIVGVIVLILQHSEPLGPFSLFVIAVLGMFFFFMIYRSHTGGHGSSR